MYFLSASHMSGDRCLILSASTFRLRRDRLFAAISAASAASRVVIAADTTASDRIVVVVVVVVAVVDGR